MATVTNFWGAESGGLEEAFSTSGTVSASSTHNRSGTYGYRITTTGYIEFKLFPAETHVDVGNAYILGFATKMSVSTGTEYFADIYNTTGVCIRLGQSSTGQCSIWDAASSTVLTTSAGVLANDGTTWDYVELYFEHKDSAAVSLYVNGNLEGSSTAEDFKNGTAQFLDTVRFYGGANAVPANYDDMYFMCACDSVDDRLGAVNVYPYRSSLNSATPDVGNALTTGTWLSIQSVPFAGTVQATYDGDLTGYVNTNDVGGSAGTGGPNTDANITGTIAAVKGTFRLERGNGGSSAHGVVLGNSSQSTYTPIEIELALATSPANFNIVKQNKGWAPTGWEYDQQMATTPWRSYSSGGMSWSDDGTYFYAHNGFNPDVRRYVCATPWDITTINTGSYTSRTFNAYAGGDFGGISLDGNYYAVAYNDTAVRIRLHALSTAWDITSASTTEDSGFDVPGNPFLYSTGFNEDTGDYLSLGSENTELIQLVMTTSYDLSTASQNYDADPGYPIAGDGGISCHRFTRDGAHHVYAEQGGYDTGKCWLATRSTSVAFDLSSTITNKVYQRLHGSWTPAAFDLSFDMSFRQYCEGIWLHWNGGQVAVDGPASYLHRFEQMAPPTPSQYCAIGLYMTGAQDLECYGMIATVLHVPPLAGGGLPPVRHNQAHHHMLVR